MTIIQHSPSETEILDFIDDSIRNLREVGAAAHFVLVGPSSYRTLSLAIAARFKRDEGRFETYAHLPIVVDPARSDYVVVLPSAPEAAAAATIVSAS